MRHIDIMEIFCWFGPWFDCQTLTMPTDAIGVVGFGMEDEETSDS